MHLLETGPKSTAVTAPTASNQNTNIEGYLNIMSEIKNNLVRYPPEPRFDSSPEQWAEWRAWQRRQIRERIARDYVQRKIRDAGEPCTDAGTVALAREAWAHAGKELNRLEAAERARDHRAKLLQATIEGLDDD
ncbi:MAG: hypothetical protein K1X64_18835 [Myxococcaceae bacterium]|nr:hypothetical protein [Myxococcaceae bacterium]